MKLSQKVMGGALILVGIPLWFFGRVQYQVRSQEEALQSRVEVCEEIQGRTQRLHALSLRSFYAQDRLALEALPEELRRFKWQLDPLEVLEPSASVGGGLSSRASPEEARIFEDLVRAGDRLHQALDGFQEASRELRASREAVESKTEALRHEVSSRSRGLSKKGLATEINLAGRQRMLLQRMTKFSMVPEPSQEVLSRTEESVRVFERTLEALIAGGEAPRSLDPDAESVALEAAPDSQSRSLLEMVQRRFPDFRRRLEHRLSFQGDAPSQLALAADGLVATMSAAVGALESFSQEANRKRERLRQLGDWIKGRREAYLIWRPASGKYPFKPPSTSELEALGRDFDPKLQVLLKDWGKELLRAEERGRAFSTRVEELDLASEAVDRVARELQRILQKRMSLHRDQSSKALEYLGWICVALPFGIALFLLQTQVIHRIRTLEAYASAFREDPAGRHSITLLGSDEIGKLGGLLRDMVREIGDRLRLRESLILEQSQSLDQVRKALDSLQQQIQRSQEVSERLERSSREGERAGVLSLEARGKADRSISRFRDFATACRSASERLLEDLEKIQVSSRGLGTISEQIRFLSLNAAIEAGRGDSSSEGFAVIAQEIRVLADQCKQVVDQSWAALGEMNEAASGVAEIGTRTGTEVESCVEGIEGLGEALETAIRVTSENRGLAREVLEHSELCEHAVQDLEGAVHSLSEANLRVLEAPFRVVPLE